MSAAVQPIVRPNLAATVRHLVLLFGDFDRDSGARIEIAWSASMPDGKGKYPIRYAVTFGLHQMEEAARFALERNATPNVNVYVGAALRKPNTPSRRAAKSDFLAATALWADLDEQVATAKAAERTQHCRPSFGVVTGRQPHTRAQLWWKLETPCDDLVACEAGVDALAGALEGDEAVVDAARVMRLAGSIAWPVKGSDRKMEVVELIEYTDGGAIRRYVAAEVTTAYAKAAAPSATPAVAPMSLAAALESAHERKKTIGERLHDVKTAKQWYPHCRDLVASLVGLGYPDSLILALAPELARPGYGVEQTRADLQFFIDGARKKYAVPNRDDPVEAPAAVTELIGKPFRAFDPARLPARQWILGRSILASNVSVLVAPPGVGKSTLTIQEALSIANNYPLTGESVHIPGAVWIYNNEDDEEELYRRIAAVCLAAGIDMAALEGRLFVNSGAERPLIVATRDQAGRVVRAPDVDACIKFIDEHGIRLFTVDPFVETHDLDENNNREIKAAAAMFREIAQRTKTKCAVRLVHHTSKPPGGSSDGFAGNIYSARGAGSLVGVARITQTLFAMSEKDAARYGIAASERRLFVRLDDAKANMSLISEDARWFRRESVDLPNGDQVGVLTLDKDMASRIESANATAADNLLMLVAETVGNGEILSLRQLAETLHATGRFKCGPDAIRKQVQAAIPEGKRVAVTVDGRRFEMWTGQEKVGRAWCLAVRCSAVPE